MPCYLKIMPKNLITATAKQSKKGALEELRRAFKAKTLSLVAYDELRRKIDACVEVPGHTHEHEHAHAAEGEKS